MKGLASPGERQQVPHYLHRISVLRRTKCTKVGRGGCKSVVLHATASPSERSLSSPPTITSLKLFSSSSDF